MNYLIDTHILIWYGEGNPRLHPSTLAEMRKLSNRVHISHATFWEMTIKLSLPANPDLLRRNPDFQSVLAKFAVLLPVAGHGAARRLQEIDPGADAEEEQEHVADKLAAACS